MMKKFKMVLTNEFHGTSAVVLVGLDGWLNPNQVRRARRKLCGIEGCRCGDGIGCRPSKFVPMPSGGGWLDI